MGKVSKMLCALGAAAVMNGMGAASASVATLKGEGLQFFIALTEQFTLAQVRNSAEFKANRTEATHQRLYREIYLQYVTEHERKQAELDQATSRIEQSGLPDLPACYDATRVLHAFVDQENLLRDYDAKVERGQNPGPVLRSREQLIRTSTSFTRNSNAIDRACMNKLTRE